jgi:hypothetical protein
VIARGPGPTRPGPAPHLSNERTCPIPYLALAIAFTLGIGAAAMTPAENTKFPDDRLHLIEAMQAS